MNKKSKNTSKKPFHCNHSSEIPPRGQSQHDKRLTANANYLHLQSGEMLQKIISQKRYIVSILASIVPINQLSLSIRGHQLTEVIETLESAGFTGNTAIFFITILQILEVGQ